MSKHIMRLACCALGLAAPGMAAADENMDGRSAFAIFRCSQCHGVDARTPDKTNTPKIAGLDSRYVVEKTASMVEKMSHKDALGACGEVPSRVQIQAIAEWVSRQPK